TVVVGLGDRRVGVGDQLLELGREPVSGGDVVAGDGVGGVGAAVAVGLGAVGVAVRVAVGVGGGGVVAVGFTRGLDPHVGDDVVTGAVGVGLRARADAGAVDVAPVAAEGALVHLVRRDVRGRGGRGGVERGGSLCAAPAVAGGVDEHADARRESAGDELVVHRLVVGVLVEVRVVLVEGHRVQWVAADLHRGVGQERLVGRGGVGGVGDEPVDGGEAAGGVTHDLRVLGARAGHVVGPAEPAGVTDVEVVVDLRADAVQLAERVGDALLVVRDRGGAGGLALVGDRVGQRVGLDEVDDLQLAVLGVALESDDRVDVLRLVLRQSSVGGRDLAVGGQCRAVTAGQVVDDDLDHHWA